MSSFPHPTAEEGQAIVRGLIPDEGRLESIHVLRLASEQAIFQVPLYSQRRVCVHHYNEQELN